MNHITLFMLGAFTGAIIISVMAHAVIAHAIHMRRFTEEYWRCKVDYWAGRVTELQGQVNDLEARKDEADYWRGE